MERRQVWLFPSMVVAAGTVTVLGCLGIAAIIGFLPLDSTGAPADAKPMLLPYDSLEQSSARLVAQADLVEAQAIKALGRRGAGPQQPQR